jgi:uncharacterized protein (DUF849 family)
VCQDGTVDGQIRRLKACLNGGRNPERYPGVPVTPAELAQSAAGAVAAGAEAVHLHPRGGDGKESLLADHIGAAVAAVREACPGVPVGVSTGLWITGGDPEARRAAVAEWAALPGAARPDFASVNLSEAGSIELADVLGAGGIGAEAGVWSVADAAALAESGSQTRWLRVLVEIVKVPAATDAVTAANEVLTKLDDLGVTAPRLLHGEGETCWPLVAQAGRLRLPTRIGLEDTTVSPDGAPVSSNAELTALALGVWTAAVPR